MQVKLVGPNQSTAAMRANAKSGRPPAPGDANSSHAAASDVVLTTKISVTYSTSGEEITAVVTDKATKEVIRRIPTGLKSLCGSDEDSARASVDKEA